MGKKETVFIGEDTCEEFYSNESSLSISNTDFIATFFRAHPQQGSDKQLTKYLCRIFMSPRHAKAVAEALNKAVENYEKKYGPIPQSFTVERSEANTSTKTLELENH